MKIGKYYLFIRLKSTLYVGNKDLPIYLWFGYTYHDGTPAYLDITKCLFKTISI